MYIGLLSRFHSTNTFGQAELNLALAKYGEKQTLQKATTKYVDRVCQKNLPDCLFRVLQAYR